MCSDQIHITQGRILSYVCISIYIYICTLQYTRASYQCQRVNNNNYMHASQLTSNFHILKAPLRLEFKLKTRRKESSHWRGASYTCKHVHSNPLYTWALNLQAWIKTTIFMICNRQHDVTIPNSMEGKQPIFDCFSYWDTCMWVVRSLAWLQEWTPRTLVLKIDLIMCSKYDNHSKFNSQPNGRGRGQWLGRFMSITG